MKIAVLASGGVDSSVVLALLKEQGHDVTAFYLKIWLEDEFSYLGSCPWEEDLEYLEKITKKLDISLKVVPMQREYWDKVVSYTISECKNGRTPNPDIFCNKLIKFGDFFDKIDSSFDKIASGHYSNIIKKGGCYLLQQAPDSIKDQSYFLSYLNQNQLSRIIFPIGSYNKKQVRELAEKYDLANKNRKDSQGICFLGKISYKDFIKEHLGEMEGNFIDENTNKLIGKHRGHWFYTIGQRFGLGLSGGPWFVVSKDIKNNIIYLSNGYDPKEVYKNEFFISNLHLICSNFKFDCNNLKVKIRHGEKFYDCSLDLLKNKVIVKDEKIHGVASGQFAVFYVEEGDSMPICVANAMIN